MKIKIKRFNESDMPTLEDGELGFAEDTAKLFVGSNEISAGTSGSDQTYTHTQSIPESVWTITLPDGFKEFPAVTITDSAGTQVFGEVNYSYPIVTLSFASAFGGQAHFN